MVYRRTLRASRHPLNEQCRDVRNEIEPLYGYSITYVRAVASRGTRQAVKRSSTKATITILRTTDRLYQIIIISDYISAN